MKLEDIKQLVWDSTQNDPVEACKIVRARVALAEHIKELEDRIQKLEQQETTLKNHIEYLEYRLGYRMQYNKERPDFHKPID